MTDLRKAAEMALEVLEELQFINASFLKCDKAAEALRQVLAQPEQEPISFEEWIKDKFGSDFMQEEPLTYFRMQAAWNSAAPPKREWVGITKEDKKEILEMTQPDERGYVIAITEAKLKEKNT